LPIDCAWGDHVDAASIAPTQVRISMNMRGREDGLAIVRAITAIGENLGTATVENMETKEQFARLRKERGAEVPGLSFQSTAALKKSMISRFLSSVPQFHCLITALICFLPGSGNEGSRPLPREKLLDGNGPVATPVLDLVSIAGMVASQPEAIVSAERLDRTDRVALIAAGPDETD
jgi:hypothetical protein